jgi:spore coat protein CotH
MKSRNVLSYAVLLFAVALLANCGNPFGIQSTLKDASKGLVTIHISDGNAGQRTLLPSTAAFSRYTLTFICEGKETVTRFSTDNNFDIELESGSWELTVKAYVAIQGQDYLAAQGTKTITVAAGQSTNESIDISANNTGEEGIFSYDIRLSLDVASLAKARLVLESLDTEYKKEIDLKIEGLERGTLVLKPGFYLLKAQLENEYQITGKTEVVHIYANMETKAEYTFKSSDLTKIIPISGAAQVITHGAAQKKVDLFIYRDEEYTDLIAHTEVNLSDRAWKTVIPDVYERAYFRLGIEDETGFFFSKAAGYEDLPEIGKIDIALSITIPEPQISSFSISAAETGLTGNLTGAIDEDESTITLASQAWIEDLDNLKAAFEASGTVTVNNVPQESGVTSQDFRSDIVYRVTAEDNAAKNYTVVFESPQATGLPVIKIDTKDNQQITSKETYVKTNIKIVDPNNEAYSFEHTEYKDEIRGRGNSTWWSYPKKPYRLKFDKKTALFGYEAAKSWVLLANYIDPTLIMNTVAFELGHRIGLPYTNHYTPVEVFLNGAYQGSYLLTEQMQVGKGRVDIDEDEGFFVELDSYYDEEPKFRTTLYDLPVMIKSPEDLDDPSGYDFVKTAINGLETAMKAGTFPESGYRDLIDMDTFVDFLLINEIVGNGELGHPKSAYMYKDKGSAKISMGPLWDFDWAFGYTGSGHAYFSNPNSRSGKHAFFQRFFEDPAFTSAFKARWNEKYAEIAGISSFIDEQAEKLKKSQVENFKIWWPGDINYDAEIQGMKSWWTARVAYLHDEINKY